MFVFKTTGKRMFCTWLIHWALTKAFHISVSSVALGNHLLYLMTGTHSHPIWVDVDQVNTFSPNLSVCGSSAQQSISVHGAWKCVNPLKYSIFWYQCDLKNHLIFKQFLKVDEKSQFYKWNKNGYIWSCMYWKTKWSSNKYACGKSKWIFMIII